MVHAQIGRKQICDFYELANFVDEYNTLVFKVSYLLLMRGDLQVNNMDDGQFVNFWIRDMIFIHF